MDNLPRKIARSWSKTQTAIAQPVTCKADVTNALYGGRCPIEAAGPYNRFDLPPHRFPHSMSAEDLNWVLQTAGITPKSLLEIGSFWGDTAILAASELKIPVVCVDTWLGGLGVWNQPPPDGFLFSDKRGIRRFFSRRKGKEIPPASQFFRQFASNIDRAGVTDLITSIRLPSPTALRLLISKGLQFDAIYVDGSHDYIDVYMDIVLSSAVAAKGALIFGDDFQEPDVADAVKDFCADTNQQFQTHSKGRGQRNYWMIHPKA